MVIALGITRRFYVLRMSVVNGRSSRHQSPVTAIEEQIFARRSAPPLYTEAMATSRPFEEYQRELREQRQEPPPPQTCAVEPAISSSAPATAGVAQNGTPDDGILSDDDIDDDMIDVGADSVSDVGGSSTNIESSTLGCLARWQRRAQKEQSSPTRAGVCSRGNIVRMSIFDDVSSASVDDVADASANSEFIVSAAFDDRPLMIV